MPTKTLKAIDKAHRITEIASDKLASDISLLETKEVCGFADYFIIVSGESERQLAAISDEIIKALKQAGIMPLRREGTPASGWMLIDYGDIVVHIFSTRERDYYKLDQMWRNAKPVVRIS